MPGAQDVDTTRASYFAGQAAMFIWSTFVLDEMAGLRNDATADLPGVRRRPGVPRQEHRRGHRPSRAPTATSPAVFGEITSWVVTAESATDPAKEFVEYMFGDGYVPWIAIAPEGKVPVRLGTADNPTDYSDQWAAPRRSGVDTKAPLSDFYSPDVLEALASRPDRARPLGASPRDRVTCSGALQGEQPVAKAVNEVTSGTIRRRPRAGCRDGSLRRRNPCRERRWTRGVERRGPAAANGPTTRPPRVRPRPSRTRGPGWR